MGLGVCVEGGGSWQNTTDCKGLQSVTRKETSHFHGAVWQSFARKNVLRMETRPVDPPGTPTPAWTQRSGTCGRVPYEGFSTSCLHRLAARSSLWALRMCR